MSELPRWGRGLEPLVGKQVSVLGFGSQGRAQALNLHDSGIEVSVGLRPASASRKQASQAGLPVCPIADAVRQADLVMMLVLTPYPNTRLFQRLQREGRILDINWEHYDYRHLVYRPARMTVDQFIEGYLQLCRSVMNCRSVWKKALQLIRDYGVTGESAAAVGFWVGSMIGTRIKEKAFRKNQGQIRRDFHVQRAFPDWENRVG